MALIKSLMDTQEFATLPPVAAHILSLLEDDDIDIRNLTKVIETDASLAIKLLRVANSPLYATRTEIRSIHQAIITMGLNRLTNIVLGVSIFSRFLLNSQKSASALIEKFWWHSSCTGIVAKALTRKLKLNFRELEFIGGLLHDIGKLAMLQFDAESYKQVDELIETKNCNDISAEEEIFGGSHLLIGGEIAKKWKLPVDLSLIISSHNHPSELQNHCELVAIVRLADILCEIWGAGIGEGITRVQVENEESWQVLCNSYQELNNLDVEMFTFELEEEFKKSSEFLSLIAKDGK